MKDPSLKLIVQRNVAKEIDKMIIENALKEVKLQDEVMTAKEEYIDAIKEHNRGEQL